MAYQSIKALSLARQMSYCVRAVLAHWAMSVSLV
jgi:hypothetical protein